MELTYGELVLEYKNRWRKFQQMMRAEGVEGAILVQAADIVYFTGTFQEGHLYIPETGDPLFMVRRDYQLACADSKVTNVVSLISFRDIPGLLRDHGHILPKKIGLEYDVLPVSYFHKYQQIFPGAIFQDCSRLVKSLRSVKTNYEIEIIRDNGKRMDNLFAKLPELLQLGKTEVELAGLFEAVARKGGHQGFLRMRGLNAEPFWGNLQAGSTATVTSYFDGVVGGPGLHSTFRFGPSFKPLNLNEPILVDYPGVFKGYIVDMTRIYVIGRLPLKLEEAHNAAVGIQDTLAKEIRPGWSAEEVYVRAKELAASLQLADHFMGYHNPVKFVGHGVGLELNEHPILAVGQKTEIKSGMVFALEPKFAFPELGVVGIENTYLANDNGLERLTNQPDNIHALTPPPLTV